MKYLRMLAVSAVCLCSFNALLADQPLFSIEENTISYFQEMARVEFEGDEDEEIILEYIDMILYDGILDDPINYLNSWAISRGMTREYRIPEDPALSFFRKCLCS